MNARHTLNHACPYATPDELDYLHDIAQLCDVCVMIGAGPGVMAMAVMEGNPSVNLHIIDNVTLDYAVAHLRSVFPNANPIQWLSDSSKVGREKWPTDKRVDLLIVDGDHTLAGVARDLDAWLPHMNKRGIVFLHDYDARGTQFESVEQYPGVMRAVNEIMMEHPGYEILTRVGTSIVFRRR